MGRVHGHYSQDLNTKRNGVQASPNPAMRHYGVKAPACGNMPSFRVELVVRCRSPCWKMRDLFHSSAHIGSNRSADYPVHDAKVFAYAKATVAAVNTNPIDGELAPDSSWQSATEQSSSFDAHIILTTRQGVDWYQFRVMPQAYSTGPTANAHGHAVFFKAPAASLDHGICGQRVAGRASHIPTQPGIVSQTRY